MKDSGLILAYIGTPDSYFTKRFIPSLQELSYAELKFICVNQKELLLFPDNPSLFTKLIRKFKRLNTFIKGLSSSFYWSIYSQQYHIQFYQTSDVNSEVVINSIKDCDFVLTAGIRSTFNSELLAAPKNGIVNFHYSLLPKYRGTHPVFWQKVQSDFNFGYTFHLMDPFIDHGEILMQNQIPVNNAQSSSEICDHLTDHASQQLAQLIQQPVSSLPQDEQRATAFTNADYLKYIHINTAEDGATWFEKSGHTNLFILNERWMVHLKPIGPDHLPNQFTIRGSLVKEGYRFKFKKINYLPPVFYYFTLRKYFE